METSDKISKHKKYGFIYGKRIKTPVGRIAWPHLIEAKESTFPLKEGETAPPPRFEVTLLLSKKDKATKDFVKELESMGEEMLDLYNEEKKKGKLAELGEVLKDGDDMDSEKYPYYAGQVYLVPKHKERPQLFDAGLDEVDPQAVKGGMRALAVIRPILTAHGLSFQLMTIQLAKDDGVRFGGGVADSKELLEELEEGSSEEESEEEVSPSVAAKEVAKGNAKGSLNLDKLG